jgi:hypothetical protein
VAPCLTACYNRLTHNRAQLPFPPPTLLLVCVSMAFLSWYSLWRLKATTQSPGWMSFRPAGRASLGPCTARGVNLWGAGRRREGGAEGGSKGGGWLAVEQCSREK